MVRAALCMSVQVSLKTIRRASSVAPICRTRGVVALDGFALYDHGRVTAFDAAGGCGDGAGDVAARQHHRQPDSQRRQQGQYDLLYILFHCSISVH